MRLRSLTIHGFKSFAARTQIDFEPGVTAIVGPNGSGKSNVADAFRWVLGEQSLRMLRAKRTEDVVFAGGAGRAPSGLAEATLTLDELDPGLDLPYSELALVRRAYRSGENEYYLNQERLRLKDVHDLVGRLGLGAQGLAVVGQGAVDLALSLRPDDRRALLEHAAAVGHLRARLADASERLTQTEANLARVADLLAELTPRLRSLERQARQAREREALGAELDRGLRRWYAHLLAGPRSTVRTAREDERRGQAELAALATRDAAKATELDRARAELEAIEREIVRGKEELSACRARSSSVEGELGLARERREHLRRWLVDLAERSERAAKEVAEGEAAARATLGERDALASRVAELDRALAEVEGVACDDDQTRRRLEANLREARDRVARAESNLAAAEARRRAADDRRRAAIEGNQARARAVEAAEREVVEAERVLAEVEAARARARQAYDAATVERRDRTQELAETRARQNEPAARADVALRAFHAARARVDGLQANEESGAGLYPGVRAVLQAANGHGPTHLNGILGVVARLIAARPEQEHAIETALGVHAQDVVVEGWTDAEAAIAELKRSGAGRATFLPLDTLRSSRAPVAPSGPGVVGVASDLVEVDARFRSVAEFLLSHTLIVRDLAAARQILARCPPSFQIVTLEGEVTRPSGAVTGGANGRTAGGALARARELREARRALAAAIAERDLRAEELGAAQAEIARAEASVEDAQRRFRAAEEALRQASTRGGDAERELARARRGRDGQQAELKRLAAEEVAARRARDELVAEAERAGEARAAIESTPTRAREALAAFEAASAERMARVSALRADRAAAIRRSNALADELRRAEARRESARKELAALDGQRSQWENEDRALETRARKLADERAALTEKDEFVSQSLKDLQTRQEAARARHRALQDERRQLQEAERAANLGVERAQAQLARARAEIDALRGQIGLELGVIDEDALEHGFLRIMGGPEPPADRELEQRSNEDDVIPSRSEESPDLVRVDGTRSGDSSLRLGMTSDPTAHRKPPVQPEVPIEPAPDAERLRQRLDTLRGRLRALPANPEVFAEYDQTRVRHAFLSEQSDDLSRTAATLRETIAETRLTVRERLDGAFVEVNDTFARRFQAIFGGGTARLERDGDDADAGIEIVAQPPGKRSQSLATLSGGERALTAAALLFALIEVNPPPFCVLDEVDAALDESNVGRFSELLRELGQTTQFVVITHNRRTMEAASAIYGLTLENRSVSRVISLRLP